MAASTTQQRLIDEMPPGLDRAVLRVLSFHVGRLNAIKRLDLVATVQTSGFSTSEDRLVRAVINQLRKEGHLICSTGGVAGGYWMAESLEEVEDYLEGEVHPRAMDLLEQEKALRQAASERWGEGRQLSLI